MPKGRKKDRFWGKMIRSFKKNRQRTELSFLIVACVVLLYIVSTEIAFLIQYPPARGNLLFVFGLGLGIGVLVFSFLEAKRMTNTKISKETCYFVLLVTTISLSAHVLTNLILNLEIPYQYIVTISVLVSTPLSCIMAGFSKRTLVHRLKRLGLNRGVTLVIIFILTLMPIIEYSPFLQRTLKSKGTVAPNLIFQSTINTAFVNGQVNSSGFFAEVPIHENRTFEAEKIVELAAPNSNKTIDLHFYVTHFMGNFECLKQLELYVTSSSERVNVVNMANGVVYSNQTIVLLQPNTTLALDIKCSGANNLVLNTTLGLSLSVSYKGYSLQMINIILKTVE